MEGNLRFKIDWASLIVRRKLNVFALFYGGLIFGGVIYRRVSCVTSLGGLYLDGLIFGILRYPHRSCLTASGIDVLFVLITNTNVRPFNIRRPFNIFFYTYDN